jgi:N-acyl-phosphatidylethanolamine-hydrolysing phospholipase D
MEGVNFLTDPVWADRCSPLDSVGIGPKRYRPVPFQLRELPHIDFVVVSHNHYDHLDISVVKGLSEKTKWYVPIGLRAWFERCGVNNVEELYWWDSAEFVKPASGEGADEGETRITVTATPCQHWSMRNGLDRCKSLWNSWAVTGASNRVWFAGDTGYCSAFKEIGDNLGPFNLGLIPIGAYCPRDFMQPQHIDPEEAVQIHKDIKAHTSIGMHWGTFILTDEPILEPREKMEELVRLKNLRDDEFITIHHGETKVFATSSFAGDQCDEQLACKERETI